MEGPGHTGTFTQKRAVITILFYDFEVFKHDWLVVIVDMNEKKEHVIINDPEKLREVYEANVGNIWTGYNSRRYDQYILKGILAGFNPKEVNDFIILRDEPGWKFSSLLRKFPLNSYDVMTTPVGLKTLEGFLGSDIKETDVPFDIDRKLTDEELNQTVYYCRHDVEETVKVFMQRKAEFEAMWAIVKAFKLPTYHIGDTEARITSEVLGCEKKEFRDEFDYFFLPCIQLEKYAYVMDWFMTADSDCTREMKEKDLDYSDSWSWKKYFYSRSLETTVAGIPHTFGWGGLHGATEKPIHATGLILHVDVNNYYPSMLIAWDLVTRAATNDNYTKVYNTRKALKKKQVEAANRGDRTAAKQFKKEQLPYKKMLNALSGAMKDNTNNAYDPRNNNCMCVNGQLMLLDLIEHLEAVPGFELIQSNTDGLIIRIPDTDEAFDMVDDICYEWEMRCSTEKCSILLELDTIREIYQKDVNNYLWIDEDGNVERIGKYVKELSKLDNDLPILNRALVEYMVHKVPVERTIRECDELIMFQKLVKLSDKYKWVEHEHGEGVEKYTNKSYRVFASSNPKDGRLLKCGGARGGSEKFADTPDHCFICNDDITEAKCPKYLDKQWYIDFALRRLKHFGITEGE